MIGELIIIILVMLGSIGLGVLLGWALWGNDMKYYKNLAEVYKNKLASPEVQKAMLEKRIKDVVNKFLSRQNDKK